MIRWTLILLAVALFAGVLSLTGAMAAAAQIAWILAFIGIVLFVLDALMGRPAR